MQKARQHKAVEFLYGALRDAIIFERPRELADRLVAEPAISVMKRAPGGESDGSTSMDTLPSTPSEASHCGRSTSQAARTSSVIAVDCGVDVGTAGRQLGDLAIVGAAVCKCALKGGRVSGHADNASRVDQLPQLAGLQQVAGQVIQPDRHPRRR